MPAATSELEADGVTHVKAVFSADEVADLRTAVDSVFRWHDADVHNAERDPELGEDFRYEMLNRSETVQRLVADRRILDIVEPLLAEDCHVVANTAWRNPPRDPTLANTGWQYTTHQNIIDRVGGQTCLFECSTDCRGAEFITGNR